MAYTLIIAEKPSVASNIANIVGARTPHKDRANGYLEGNGYRVTWAFGHLVGLIKPEALGFKGDTLPIIPEEWKTDIIQPTKGDMAGTIAKQMKTLDSLFKGADKIIVATDAGREGELIFRYIYEYLGHRVPFDRLWISSLTDEAIRNGLDDIRPGREFDALSDAAHARSEADWLVGYNASRALRVSSGYKGNLSLGRVQTPVLCMVCDRYEENKNFVPTPYWQVSAIAHKDMANFTVLSVNKYQNEKDAKEAAEKAGQSKRMRVTNVEKKQMTTKPPLLYDLTALQRAANTKFGLTAEETLKTAQSLYEKKYLTYPRTGSRYISEDVYKTIPSLIEKATHYGRFAEAAAGMKGKKLCRKSVNDSKVTDHHALLPTPNIPTGLTGNEKAIWEMVCGRMLEAFGEDSLSERTTALFECGGTQFRATGTVILKPGWKSVFGVNEPDEKEKKDDEDEEENGNAKLPPLNEGEVLPAGKIEVVRKTDKPLPIYTDASLLAEMETCGKKIDDEELREAMKDIGLGTPATRAQTIETLIVRKYIERKAKKLIPTELGTAIWKMVRGRRIADVKTSGEWERDLALIEQGKIRKEKFDEGIRKFTVEVIDDIRNNCKSLDGVSTSAEPTHTCPCCGKPMRNLKYNILCDAASGGCGLKIYREMAGKKLPASAINALASGKETALIKGFTNKTGNSFDAKLKVDTKQGKVTFVTNEAPAIQGRKCPCCGNVLEDNKWKLSCDCGFTLYKTLGGVTLKEAQVDGLLTGNKVTVNGMVGKSGKKFDAKVSINKETKKLNYEFINKK